MATAPKKISDLTADTKPLGTDLVAQSDGSTTYKSTVAQINSSTPLVFADTTARDAYFTAPTNGNTCYVTALNAFSDYVNGAWQTRATGTAYTGGDGITVTAGDIDVDLTDTVIFKNARTGNEVRATVTAAGDGKLDKTFMPTYVENLIDSGTSVAEIDQVCDGVAATTTATNLNELTSGGGTLNLHYHTRKFGVGSVDGSATSQTLNITHGLGTTPKWVRIVATKTLQVDTGTYGFAHSTGEFDGTNYALVWVNGKQPSSLNYCAGSSTTNVIDLESFGFDGYKTTATCALTSTQIQLSVTNGSTSAGTTYIYWECGV